MTPLSVQNFYQPFMIFILLAVFLGSSTVFAENFSQIHACAAALHQASSQWPVLGAGNQYRVSDLFDPDRGFIYLEGKLGKLYVLSKEGAFVGEMPSFKSSNIYNSQTLNLENLPRVEEPVLVQRVFAINKSLKPLPELGIPKDVSNPQPEPTATPLEMSPATSEETREAIDLFKKHFFYLWNLREDFMHPTRLNYFMNFLRNQGRLESELCRLVDREIMRSLDENCAPLFEGFEP